MGLPGFEPDRGVRVAIEISLEAGNFGGLYIEKTRLQFASLAGRESRRCANSIVRHLGNYVTPFARLVKW
jgi:hypothetical protein